MVTDEIGVGAVTEESPEEPEIHDEIIPEKEQKGTSESISEASPEEIWDSHYHSEERDAFFCDDNEGSETIDDEDLLYPSASIPTVECVDQLMSFLDECSSASSGKRLFEMVRGLLPRHNKLPSYYTAKGARDFLSSDKVQLIDACPSDCCLYTSEFQEDGITPWDTCKICNKGRYKEEAKKNQLEEISAGPRVPMKIFRWIGLEPQLHDLFATGDFGKIVQLHENFKDEEFVHLWNSLKWKEIWSSNTPFSKDSRNIVVCVCTDGVSPFHTQFARKYCMWPILIKILNVHQWA